ncbi:MAG: hypothetical protein H7Z39_20330, partial [Burkholderiaceae bacterium]|nr:hypothetical protein [Burkholderiaceae bacterium]
MSAGKIVASGLATAGLADGVADKAFGQSARQSYEWRHEIRSGEIGVTDTVAPAERSRIMARVRSKDTSPEWIVRRLVFAAGYRYRLHVRALPGTPDLVFPGRRKVILV